VGAAPQQHEDEDGDEVRDDGGGTPAHRLILAVALTGSARARRRQRERQRRPCLADRAVKAEIDRAPSYAERWSDHAPVVVRYDVVVRAAA
jgi:hypothetical protein